MEAENNRLFSIQIDFLSALLDTFFIFKSIFVLKIDFFPSPKSPHNNKEINVINQSRPLFLINFQFVFHNRSELSNERY